MKPSPRPLLIVLNGQDFPREALVEWAQCAEFVLAADGAAGRLLPDVIPTLTLGDGDSHADQQGVPYLLIADQETTDCDKVLAYAREEGYVRATVIGLEGDRLDHMLASLGSCARSGLEIELILRSGRGLILHPGCHSHDHKGTVSVMPLERSVVSLRQTEWEVGLGVFDPLGVNSISNEARGPFEVEVHSGCVVLFLAY